MKIKFKRYLSLFCVVLMIISTLVDGLSTTVQATINSSQNLTNNSDNIEVYSTSNITVYNDKSNNGWYYFTEDGVKKQYIVIKMIELNHQHLVHLVIQRLTIFHQL